MLSVTVGTFFPLYDLFAFCNKFIFIISSFIVCVVCCCSLRFDLQTACLIFSTFLSLHDTNSAREQTALQKHIHLFSLCTDGGWGFFSFSTHVIVFCVFSNFHFNPHIVPCCGLEELSAASQQMFCSLVKEQGRKH